MTTARVRAEMLKLLNIRNKMYEEDKFGYFNFQKRLGEGEIFYA